MHCIAEMPPDQNGYCRCPNVPANENIYRFSHHQQIDTSEEMRKLSLRANVSGEFAEITVMRGDTLGELAKELGVTVEDLVRWNNIANPDSIYAGQSLMVDVNRVKYSTRLHSSSFGHDRTTQSNRGNGNERPENTGKIWFDFSSVAVTAGIELTLFANEYKYLKSLIRNKQFLGIKNGLEVVMDNSWLGTNRMNQVRGPMRTAFNSRVNGLARLKWGGNALGIVTTGYSLYKWIDEPNWSDGLDVAFGAAGIYYWPIGVGYTWFRYVVPAAIPYVIQLEMERAEEIKKGNWSMALWRPGRALR